MNTIVRLGTFEDVLAQAPSAIAEISRTLPHLIEQLHPDAVEVPRPGEPSVAYGFGEKKMTEAYAYIMPCKNHVNLGFYHGANLAPHFPNLAGTGKKLRHVKIYTLDQAQSGLITTLLEAAITERRGALNL